MCGTSPGTRIRRQKVLKNFPPDRDRNQSSFNMTGTRKSWSRTSLVRRELQLNNAGKKYVKMLMKDQ